MTIKFEKVDYLSNDWRLAVQLREEILRKPLKSKFSTEELRQEKDHIHIVGKLNKEIIATSVLVPENNQIKMQRVVVVEKLRNRDTGSKMMLYCEEVTKSNGINTIYCHARNSAVNFYLKNGYDTEGDVFDEDGIPHLKMIKKLK